MCRAQLGLGGLRLVDDMSWALVEGSGLAWAWLGLDRVKVVKYVEQVVMKYFEQIHPLPHHPQSPHCHENPQSRHPTLPFLCFVDYLPQDPHPQVSPPQFQHGNPLRKGDHGSIYTLSLNDVWFESTAALANHNPH